MVLALNTSFAQTYIFSKKTATYTEFSGGTSASGTKLWTHNSTFSNIPIGFSFPFYNQTFTQLNVNGNGFIDFNSQNYAINFFLANMKDKGTGTPASPVTYKTEGTAGTRIFKLQFKNAGMINGASDYLNMQVWLYETTGRIELHFGTISITGTTSYVPPYTGALVSVENWATNEVFYLQGDGNNPTLVTTEKALSTPPSSGTVYVFKNKNLDTGTGIGESDLMKAGLKIWPNPAKDIITLEHKDASAELTTVVITDMAGRVCQRAELGRLSQGCTVNIQGLNKGHYYIKVYNGTKSGMYHFIKD